MRRLKGLVFLIDIVAFVILCFIPFYVVINLINIFDSFNSHVIFFNLVLLIVETFGLIFSYYLVEMIASSILYQGEKKIPVLKGVEDTFFSIIVPSHGTEFPILEKTLRGALNLEYNNFELIVSDNGKNQAVTEKLQKFCTQKGIVFYHKKDERGFKAGNINAVLNFTKGDYVVILDSDHIPVPSLLQQFSSIVKNPKIGFIQAKVSYRNVTRLYQKANSILYSQFYEVIESAKDRRGMVLFNGTTGCFRKSVLEEIGGFSEDTLIEDIDTSMQILARGYEGKFINFIGSYGLVPATAKAQISQLWRWTHGACNILRIRLRLFVSTPHIGWFKKFELILNTMAFFSGISVVFFFSILVLMLNFNMVILRQSVMGFNTIYIMPLLVSSSYSIIALLTIIWEENDEPFLLRMLHLIPFYILSLGSFLFLISGVIEGLLLRNTPVSETSVWDKQFNVVRSSVFALIFTAFIILLAIRTLPNEYSFFILGGTFPWIFAPCILIWEELFPPKTIN